MKDVIVRNLRGERGHYLMPFLWMHGEPEAVLREMMAAVDGAGIGAVCIESRPHPDFVGPKWWQDMDVILDEARKRGMKVWILDDSHFPTGFANGALEKYDVSYRRQSVVCETVPVRGKVALSLEPFAHPVFVKNRMEQYTLGELPVLEGDRIFSVCARNASGEAVSLMEQVKDGVLYWDAPEGEWQLSVCTLTRNMGPHRNYINMLSKKSCQVLLDAVYEPHWAHYREDFGHTIAGFFSDEPELGNGHLYDFDDALGKDLDLPWSEELEAALIERLGADAPVLLPLLWDKSAMGAEKEQIARVRYAYMDAVTRLVEKDFSELLGDWCHAHGVEYIGHLIEDNDHHSEMGSSLGHYFRGLSGMDMAGIDDIGGQVLPQGEDIELMGPIGQARDGVFYHYAMGKLAASFAAIDPKKQGRAMCEIFGAYGWSEGVSLMKYLADHFMVRGVNRFVPHAFSGKDYPDPDCPPHFYAHGHNPQYRHFGALARYMDRVCALLSQGQRTAAAAVLYHGEAKWTGKAMKVQVPARILLDRQADLDILPTDVFLEPARYRTDLSDGLSVNGRAYRVLIVPEAEFVSASLARAVSRLHSEGFPVIFLGSLPRGLYDGAPEEAQALLSALSACTVMSPEALGDAVEALGLREVSPTPESDRLRVLHMTGSGDGYFLINESAETYSGTVRIPQSGPVCLYDPWENRLLAADGKAEGESVSVPLTLEPRHSIWVLFGTDLTAEAEPLWKKRARLTRITDLTTGWRRSLSSSVDYPRFDRETAVSLPDNVAEQLPDFSGFVRYETAFSAKAAEEAVLEITGDCEGVEVFLNGESLGIQIVPTYRYDLTGKLVDGENLLTVECATTLERENYEASSHGFLPVPVPTEPTGLSGSVRLLRA